MTDAVSNEAERERPAPSAAAGPLAGLRVLELGGEQADYAGLLCAGLGATVVKVEPPDGSRSRQIGPFHGGDRPTRSGRCTSGATTAASGRW